MKKVMEWYERRIAPIAFVAGFIFDSVTLTRADLPLDNAILIAHLSVSALGILGMNAHARGRAGAAAFENIAWLFPFAMQFSFGALFSGFVVLYARSGSIAASWLFIAILFFLLVGNEFFRDRYRRLVFHLNVYFVALFSYFVLAVPLVQNRVGRTTFLISGAAALTVMALFAAAVAAVAGRRAIRENLMPLASGIAGTFLLFNVLYFARIIPPIPLVLKRLAVYHSIERTADGGYRVRYERPPRYDLFRETDPTYRWVPGSPVYAYSAVFAPADIGTVIAHRWEYFDEKADIWIDQGDVQFPISGGRGGGYRGYSIKYGIRPGRWRIEARTGEGQILGRQTFRIVEAADEPELAEQDL